MLQFISKRYAKARYSFRQLVEAETNELHAKLAETLVKEHQDNAARLRKEADTMDARIKEVEDMELKGYWLCDNGHEHDTSALSTEIGKEHVCLDCREPAKLIKRDQMTAQEKYESDKERGEAQDIAKQKRQEADQEEQSAQESDKAAKYFRGIAQNNRKVADKLRRI